MFTILQKHKRKFIATLAIAGSATFISLNKPDEAYFEIAKNLDIFATLFREVNMYYVDETKPGQLVKKGIDEMLNSLDPYTNYIPESDVEDYRFMTTGQYGGVGSTIRTNNGYVIIADPYENYPAFKADLRAGDKIIEIDSKPMKGKKSDDVSKLLKGAPGTVVTLMVEREGETKNLEKKITREEIKIKSVQYHGMLNETIGYITLSSFTENASTEIRDAVLDLKKNDNLKGIVLDLRGNPGGLLNESVNIVNVFVDKGQEVVSTRGKVKEWEKSYKTINTAVDATIPIAVLVNSGSASASEIVSGAIQDLDRGVVIGQRTFGKGLVQTTRKLSYNSQLKVTTAKYYIPSGRCIQALDYTNRNEDGSVGKVADSLMKPFKTKSGRVVYDGGGVLPDVKTSVKTYSKIATSLANKSLLFDYATTYKLKHATIAPAKEFELSDNEYKEFCDYAASKEYDYTTKSEKLLKELKESAETEKYFERAQPEYEALKAKLVHNKNEDLQSFKTEIKHLLEAEIVGRYYYQKGRTQNVLAHDADVASAIELLNDKDKYNSLLKGVAEPENKTTKGNTKKK
jgi:carboxyl-terminal processing protease